MQDTLSQPEQAGDVERLREQFPGWQIEARWSTAGTGPDARCLLASRGGVTLTAWSPGALAAAIGRQEGSSDD
jgi:hypothetical protein